MRWSHLDQLDLALANRETEPAGEGLGRQGQLDLAPVEGRHLAPQGPHHPAEALQAAQVARQVEGHRLPGRVGGDDASPGKQLIAPDVVAVRVGVEDDLRLHCDKRPGRVEHAPGQPQIPERVDEQHVLARGHQPRIRLSEATIGLQPGPGLLAHLREAPRKARRLPVKCQLRPWHAPILPKSHATGEESRRCRP